MKNNIKIAAYVMMAGLGLASCSMDLLPLNEVVLENFWKEGEDVQSVMNSCYTAIKDPEYIQRLIVWGECRSDNTTFNTGRTKDAKELRDLMEFKHTWTNKWCEWGPMYTVINRCNTVLYYATEVAQKDPNYTESDYKITQAEAKFLRAYSYLTLIKTFKDVPFSLEPSIDDTQEYRLGQTPFNTILNALIDDIESCKNYPPVKYASDQHYYTTGRVTRLAMYSLLAELYLWRASDASADISSRQSDYRSCIACCDYVLNAKISQYKENSYNDDRTGQQTKLESICDRNHIYTNFGIPLLKESDGSASTLNGSMATNSIFCDGNSFESIFEITFINRQDNNLGVSELYGGSAAKNNEEKLVYALPELMAQKPTAASTNYSNGNLFSVTSDYRSIASFYYKESGSAQSIYKYVLNSNYAGVISGSSYFYGAVGANSFNEPTRDQSATLIWGEVQSTNWILYRLTEVILFRAEAEIALAGTISGDLDTSPAIPTDGFTGYHNGADLISSGDLYADAFNLIKAVYWRSNPSATSLTQLLLPQITNFTTYGEFMKLLMQERRREFLFEGKRYYDLVRQARRIGNNDLYWEAIKTKAPIPANKVPLQDNPDIMYMPVSESQIKVNPNLVQNPCFNDETESIKN